jgi:hypothetical protein
VEGKLIVTLSAGGVIDDARFEGLATQGVGLCLAQHVRGTRLADYTGGPAQVHCKYWGLIEADGPELKQKTRFLPIVAHDLDPERAPPGP